MASEVNMATFRKQIVIDTTLCNQKGQQATFRDVNRAREKSEKTIKGGTIVIEDFSAWFKTPLESVVFKKNQSDILMDMLQNHYPHLVEGLSMEEIFIKIDANGDGEVTAEEITRWVIRDSIPFIDDANTTRYEVQIQNEDSKPEMQILKAELLALQELVKAKFNANDAKFDANEAKVDALDSKMEKDYVKKHPWEQLGPCLGPHHPSNPLWQYACHIQSCITDTFAGHTLTLIPKTLNPNP